MESDPLDDVWARMSMLPDIEQQELLDRLRGRYPIHALESRWGAPAEVILEAIARSSDLSQRGVLGLIAEASFKVNVIDQLDGWRSIALGGDYPYDFEVARANQRVRIQVKRQRMERGVPRPYRRGSHLFTAETQRTRSGRTSTGEATRPYRFGEFDILAVSMQPATDDWTIFRYAPERWLLPRPAAPELLRVMQPVSLKPNEDWSASLEECIDRLGHGGDRRISET